MIIYKCLKHGCACKFKDINRDGLRCPKCKNPIIPFNLNPTEEDLSKVPTYKEIKKSMQKQISISLKDIKPFKETIDLLKNILSDDRIPEELRIEYKNKCSELLNIN